MTPAFLILPLLSYLASRANSPRMRGAVQSVTLAAAGLIVSAMLPLAQHATSGALHTTVAVVAFLFLILTRRDTLWVIAGAAAIGLLAACAPFSRL
jgi:chromate transport protein ChrA